MSELKEISGSKLLSRTFLQLGPLTTGSIAVVSSPVYNLNGMSIEKYFQKYINTYLCMSVITCNWSLTMNLSHKMDI